MRTCARACGNVRRTRSHSWRVPHDKNHRRLSQPCTDRSCRTNDRAAGQIVRDTSSRSPGNKETAMANPFVHVELNTTDVGKAKDFYGKLFDWKLEDAPMPQGTYTLINVGQGTGGGMVKQTVPGAPSAWLPYVVVDDIDASTKKAKSLGAKVVVDITE